MAINARLLLFAIVSSLAAYGKVANMLLRAITDHYRRKQINRYIEEANAPIQVLINALHHITGTVIRRLYTSLETRYQVFYDHILQTANSGYEKAKAVQEYYEQINLLKAEERQLEMIGQNLGAIAKGHQFLYEHRNKLSAKELQQQIFMYSGQINDLVNQFHIFKI